jgi:MoaA/NifB/PqqE/SkfB family radical SAM enzyme
MTIMGLWKAIKRHPLRRLIQRHTVDNPLLHAFGPGRFVMDQLIRYRTRPSARNKPAMIIIENTNFCNATCIMCPHASGFVRQKQFLEEGLYRKVIAEMVHEGIPRLQLNGTGEPLLDKRLTQWIRVAKEMGVPHVYLYTNASLLTATKGAEILDSGLDEMRISFDGLSRSEFESIRVGLNYDTVSANIVGFLRMKQQLKRKKPFVYVTGYVRNTEWEQDSSPIYNDLDALADDLDIVSYDKGVHDWGGTLPVGTSFAAQASAYSQVPCRRLWEDFNVHSDGVVAACCIDHEGVLQMGDIRTSSIMEIWNGETFTELRARHLKRQLDEVPLCQNCSERPSWLTPERR